MDGAILILTVYEQTFATLRVIAFAFHAQLRLLFINLGYITKDMKETFLTILPVFPTSIFFYVRIATAANMLKILSATERTLCRLFIHVVLFPLFNVSHSFCLRLSVSSDSHHRKHTGEHRIA